MNPFKKTKRNIVFMTIIVITAIVAYVVFFIGIKNKNENISLIVNKIDSFIEKETKLKSVKKIIEDTESTRRELDTYFVTDNGIVDFIENIEALAEEVEINAEVLSVDINDNNKISETLLLSLEVEGLWSSLFYFISLIEELPFKIDVSKVDIEAVYTNTNKSKTSGSWKGTLNFSVLKLKENI